MDKATDKQIYFLKQHNIIADNLSKQAASEIISNLKNSPSGKIVKSPEIEEEIPVVRPGEFKKPNFKKTITPSSYYVSYAKDICVALIESNAYPDKKFSEDPTALMDIAINMIKKAIVDLS